jgi:hypothetical protein
VYGKTGTTQNTYLGYNAGLNTTGNYNSALGVDALKTNVSGEQITAIGWNAGKDATGTRGTFVGTQSGSLATGTDNTAIGNQALQTTTTGGYNTAIGAYALGQANTTGGNNTAVGFQAAYYNTSGGNTAVGYQAFYSNSSGNNATCVGYHAGYSNTTDTELTAYGYRAAYANTTGSGGGRNTAIGVQALEAATTAYNNTAVGWRCLKSVITGTANVAMGQQAGQGHTGNEAVFIGNQCATEATSGNGNTCINSSYGGSRIFALTTESNRLLMGHNGISNAYVQVAWTVTSDARDKTDIVTAPYGLAFVNELRPIQYRWDRRKNYTNGQPDGTHKEDKKTLGFLAQEVIELEKKYGGIAKDLLIADDEQDDMLKITETKMIPILVKAIQELKAEFDAYKSTHP